MHFKNLLGNKKALVAIAFTSALVILGCKTHFPVTTEKFTVAKNAASIENGKNLTANVCGQCHYNYHINSYTGMEMRELPGFMGKVYSANLTNDHIVSDYSDAELFYLLKTGIAKDGRFIPYMIRPTMADEDMKDIIAYLRTSDAPLKRNDTVIGVTHLSALGKLATKVAGKPQPYKTNEKRPADNPIAEGRYLVDIIGCYHCHSKSMLGLNYTNPEDSKGYMAGGMKFNIDGEKIRASNLTPDMETGIGKYDKVSFRNAVREGVGLNGRKLQYPMHHFKKLTDEQSDAIFAYLKSLPAEDHRIKGQPSL